jgi:hypothetical protein
VEILTEWRAPAHWQQQHDRVVKFLKARTP